MFEKAVNSNSFCSLAELQNRPPTGRGAAWAFRLSFLFAPVVFWGVFTSPASAQSGAELWGLEQVWAFGPSGSTDSKTATATCPAGKRVVSAGAEITGRNVFLDGIVPDGTMTSVTVSAREDPVGTTDNWFLKAWAVCLPEMWHNALAIERVEATSNLTFGARTLQTVSCPSGKQLTGVGAAVVGGGGHIMLDQVVPVPGLTVSQANASRDSSGFVAGWRLTAIGLCGNFSQFPNPVQPYTLQLVTQQSSQWGSRPQLATAQCPAGNVFAFGGGGAIISRVSGPWIPGGQGRVALDELRPGDTWFRMGASVGGAGAPFTWHGYAYVICWMY